MDVKVYVISSQDNNYFAKKVLNNLHNYRLINSSLINPSEIFLDSIKRHFLRADAIIIIIDKDFMGNAILNSELQQAIKALRKNRECILFPIILDDATVPIELEDRLCIRCDSKSDEDIERTKVELQRVLLHRKQNSMLKNSQDSRSLTSVFMMLMTVIIQVVAILLGFGSIKAGSLGLQFLGDERIATILSISTMMLAVVSLATSYLAVIRSKLHEDNEEEIESYSRRLKRAIVAEDLVAREQSDAKDEQKNKIDALGRMLINLEDIKEFYTWSQKQAKSAFRLAVTMCIAGFALVVVAVLLPVVFDLNIETAIIPAVGGVITEVIAGTALVVYRHSFSQLNHYHNALHEDEKFLSSVNLVHRFSTPEAQDEMLREIIRSEIQMNLFVANEDRNRATD